MRLQNEMNTVREVINTELDKALALPEGKSKRVVEAMRYSAIGTGKALRPFLAIIIGKMLDIPTKTAVRIGLAIEMLHTYSLIHDDLPAMDNDTLRRGKPTNHIQFDEATAILAGDALQSKAFEILANPETSPSADIRSDLVLELSKAAGANGMVGGQMMDLIGETQPLTLDEIESMQALKTGALLYFSCLAPAVAARADEATREALTQYARALGLMFQITDDILDVEGETAQMGKTLGKDAQENKSTFVSILGIEKARSLAQKLADQAREALVPFGDKADLLNAVVTFVLERKH